VNIVKNNIESFTQVMQSATNHMASYMSLISAVTVVENLQATVLCRPVESHSGARENILAGPPNISRGPSGEKIFEFFFSKWYILAYFIILADGGAPKRRGARGSLPLPHPLDGLGAMVTRLGSQE